MKSLRSRMRRGAYVVDALESRFLMAYVSVFVDAVTVGMVGDSSADAMTISTDGVNLFHTRKTAGDADFASDYDFDTTVSGVQLLPDALGFVLSIQAGDGSDSLTVTGPAGAMSIKTQLAFQGEAATDTLTIEDNASPVGRTSVLALADGVVTGFVGQPMGVLSTEELIFGAGSQADTIVVDSKPLGVFVTLSGGGGDDVITVNGFDKMAGSLIVNGASGNDILLIDDAAELSPEIYTLSSGSISRVPGTVTFFQTEAISLIAGSAADEIRIFNGVSSAGTTIVDGKGGNDTYKLGNGSLDAHTRVDINDSGVNDTDTVLINDSADTTPNNSYLLPDHSLIRNGVFVTSYAGVTSATLNTTDLADSVEVTETQTIPLILKTNLGADKILLSAALNGAIDGGGDGDTVSYENIAGPVTANLSSGSVANATSVISIEGLIGTPLGDTLTGGAGSTTIAGGDGADSITGGPVGDSLFGEAGNDTVRGQGGDDTVSGGDNNDTISGDSGNDTVTGDAGNDFITHTDPDGSDILDGGDDNDQLNAFGSDVSGDQVVFSDGGGSLSIARINLAPYNLNVSAIEIVNYDSMLGADVLAVSSGNSGLLLNLIGGYDADAFIIGSDGLVGGILSPISIDGSLGDDAVIVDDSKKTSPDIVTVTGSKLGHGAGDQFFGPGGALSYGNVAIVNLTTPDAPAGDKIKLSPSADVAFELTGGTPANPTIVGDKLSFDLTGIVNAVLTPAGDAAGSVSFDNALPVNFKQIEDLGAGALKFSSPTFVVNENGAFAIVTIQRVLGSDGDVTVDFATSDGTATDTIDYSSQAITFPFADGVTQQSLIIPILDDLLSEADETIALALSSVTGNALLVDGKATSVVKIIDNEPLPAMVIGDVSASEGNSGKKNFTFDLLLTEVSGREITVEFTTTPDTATSPSDFDAITGSVTFAPGETSKTITIKVNGDTSFESTEKFFVDLSNADGAVLFNTRGTGTITNDDSGITSFTLINASTDQDIMTLNNGAVLNLNALPSSLAIRANYGGSPKSVKFGFDANASFRKDNSSPFSLFNESGGNFSGGTLSVGTHTLKATPFSQTNATGTAGASKTISFQVVKLPVVSKLVLVNAANDTDIMTLTDGAVLKRSQLPSSLTIRASILGSAVSVRFALDGNGNFRTENVSPFSLFGNIAGNYNGGTLALGSHTLTVTPYTALNATGTAGGAKTIHFTVIA